MTRREISFSPGSVPPIDGQSRLVSTELRAERTRFNWSAQQSQPFVDPAWPIQDLRGRFFGRTSFLRPGKTLIKTLPVPLPFYGLREKERERELSRTRRSSTSLPRRIDRRLPPFALTLPSRNHRRTVSFDSLHVDEGIFFLFFKNVIEDGWLIREWGRKCSSSS